MKALICQGFHLTQESGINTLKQVVKNYHTSELAQSINSPSEIYH